MKTVSRRFAHLFTILLCLGSLLISFFLAEMFLRMFYPQKLLLNVSRWDPYVGFVNIPNFEGYSETADFKMRVTTNSHGLRDREFDYRKPQDTIRIGIFGDSFTFGEGVQNNESYPKILEGLLRSHEQLRNSPVNIEVINFGIGKTGTSHQYALYQKEGRKYQLDVVVLGFFGCNDFSDNRGGVFYLQDNVLIHNPTAFSSVRRLQSIVYQIPFYKWMASHSHFVNLLRYAATILDDRIRAKNPARAKANSTQVMSAQSSTDYLTLRLIEAFREAVADDQCHFMVVNLPTSGQKSLEGYTDGEQPPAFVKQSHELMEQLGNSGFNVLDLAPVFSNLPKSGYYFESDHHMTAKGHHMVASSILMAILPDGISRQTHLSGQIPRGSISTRTGN